MTDHDKLRELAQAATPGPYHIDYIESGEHGLFIDEDRAETAGLGCGGTEVAGFLTKANAEFIAAANPTVVLALLDELRDAKSKAWDEGYMRGQHPFHEVGQEDPIPPNRFPPSWGSNANPYREGTDASPPISG